MFFAVRSISCLMCSQLEQFQSIQIVRKALFFKLIYTLIYTRSFSRGFSLATSSYVLGGRTALIAAKLYCSLGNYSQTAIFPRMPSITRIYQVLLTWVCSWKLDASYWKIYKRTKMVRVDGFEPSLYRFSYHYNFRCSSLICGLDFLFIMTFLF